MLVPLLVALQFMLADRFRLKLALLSLLLFGVICFSHPLNFLFCSIFIAVFWLMEKKQCRWVFLALGAVLVAAAINFAFNCRTSVNLGLLVERFLSGDPKFSVWGNAPYIALLYVAQISLLLIGVIASVYFIRRREYLPIIVLFWTGLGIGISAMSGIFLYRGFTRMFAYALIMGLVLLGLLLRELLLTKPRVAKCLFGYVVALYFLCAFGVVVRFQGLYFLSIRFD